MRLIGYAVISWAIFIFLGWIAVQLVFAQSPQDGARVSYVQCPPDMQYDPKRSYMQIKRLFGTVENRVFCTEYVAVKKDGAFCQIAFTCENAT